MEFSIVIATRDRARYLDRALGSLAAQVGAPAFETIVVDNGSSDDTQSVVRRHQARVTAIRYVAEPQPNRGAARNRGVDAAVGRYVLFCDDDVDLPERWVAAHAAAHPASGARVVNGPILNVTSGARPKPRLKNYSRAFLCTCNASLPRAAFCAAGGFDERFDRYGWEDTELGLRLRSTGLAWSFAWDAYLWHVKPPTDDALDAEIGKAIERARMAAKFLLKHPSWRTRLATGAHPLNLIRGRYLLPDRLIALFAGVAASPHPPGWARAIARGQLLDALYTRELSEALERTRV